MTIKEKMKEIFALVIYVTITYFLLLFCFMIIFTKPMSPPEPHFPGEYIRKTLLLSQDKITFLTSTITLKDREERVFYAIRNNRDTHLVLEVENGFSCYDGISKKAREQITQNPELIKFDTFSTWELGPGEASVLYFFTKGGPNLPNSIYACEADIRILEEYTKEYGEKKFIRSVSTDAPKCDKNITIDCKKQYALKEFMIEVNK